MDQSHKAINADSRSGETTCPKQHSDNLSFLIWSQILWLVHCREANIGVGANTWALGENVPHTIIMWRGRGKLLFMWCFEKRLMNSRSVNQNWMVGKMLSRLTIAKDTGATLLDGRHIETALSPCIPAGLTPEMRTTSSKAHHVLWQVSSKPVPAVSEEGTLKKINKKTDSSFFHRKWIVKRSSSHFWCKPCPSSFCDWAPVRWLVRTWLRCHLWNLHMFPLYLWEFCPNEPSYY